MQRVGSFTSLLELDISEQLEKHYRKQYLLGKCTFNDWTYALDRWNYHYGLWHG